MCAEALLYASGALGSYAGTRDPSFGSDGATVAQILPGTANVADSLALQPDGKIVVGVYASADPSDGGVPSTAAVARLLPDGAFDPRFGSAGRVLLPGLEGFAPSSVAFDEQPPPPVRLKVLSTGDGRVLVLGSSLIRLNSNGSVDSTFGSSGTASLPASFSPTGMALAPGGEIVLVGNRSLPGAAHGAVVRLTADGQPDPKFDPAGSGMATIPTIDDSKGRPLTAVDYRGVLVAGNGAITVAGVGRASDTGILPRDGLLARLTAAGSLDPAFGQSGQTLVERYGGIEAFDSFDPNALALTQDGRVLVGASAGCGLFMTWCLPNVLAFPSDGNGEGLSNDGGGCYPSHCRQSVALSTLPRGRLLVGAWEGDLVLGLFGADLKPVSGFGISEEGEDICEGCGALAQLPAGSQTVGNMLVLPDGKIVVAGTAGSEGIIAARLFGLSPAPRPQVRLLSHRARSVAGVVSVPVDCRRYVSCRGLGTLWARSANPRRRSMVLVASGPFDIAGGASALVTMPLTPAGSTNLRRRRATLIRMRVTSRGARTLEAWIRVPRPARLAAPRHGAPGELAPVAGDVQEFISDGRRYVAFQQAKVIYVLDTTTQRRYASRIPKDCANEPEPLRGISFPMVLLSCYFGSELVNVATQRLRVLPNPSGVREEWPAIGSSWVGPARARDCPNFFVCDEYLNWRTNAVRRIDSPPVPATATGTLNEVIARDLDSSDLAAVSPCPPSQPSDFANSLLAYPRLYEPPYVIYGEAVDPFNGNPMNSAPQAPPGLVLGRCGAAMPVALDTTAIDLRSQFEPPGDQIGARIVSWYSPPSATVSLYEISQGRRLHWVAPLAVGGFSEPAAIAHTAFSAIVATASHQFCRGERCSTDSWTLYQARLR